MELRKYFKWGGVSSKDLGVFLARQTIRPAPTRNIENIIVPGRNGDLKIDQTTYKNVKMVYVCSIAKKDIQIQDAARSLREWLMADGGYKKLVDDYTPDFYQMASFTGPQEIARALRDYGTAEIEFDCKPQLFLLAGEQIMCFATPGSIYNPTRFIALPNIRVYGNAAGTVSIGNVLVQIKEINEYIDLDCELEDAFKGVENWNSKIYAPLFPYLAPGETGISWNGGITKIEIKPRWWTL